MGASSPSHCAPRVQLPFRDHTRATPLPRPPHGQAGRRPRAQQHIHAVEAGAGLGDSEHPRSPPEIFLFYAEQLPGPQGGCCIAPLGAQLVHRVHRGRARGSKRAGGARPGLPSFAASSPQRRKASGFWRESLGASPDFYGNQEGGVKPLSSAFLPPPCLCRSPLLSPPPGCVRFFS